MVAPPSPDAFPGLLFLSYLFFVAFYGTNTTLAKTRLIKIAQYFERHSCTQILLYFHEQNENYDHTKLRFVKLFATLSESHVMKFITSSTSRQYRLLFQNDYYLVSINIRVKISQNVIFKNVIWLTIRATNYDQIK